MDRLRSDLIDALRELRIDTLTVTVAVTTLAAAIGMNVAMFGLVDRALVSPPKHISRPDRLFSFSFHAPGEPEGEAGMTTTSYVTYRQLRDHVASFPAVAAWQPGPRSVVVDGEQTRADTLLISGNYFEVLGASPRTGKGITAANETNGIAVAVISDAFWHTAFRSDPEILSRRLVADGIEYAVGGVAPLGFSGHSAASVDVWLPLSTALRSDAGWSESPFRNVVSVFGRVGDSITPAVAAQQATAMLNRTVALSSPRGCKRRLNRAQNCVLALGCLGSRARDGSRQCRHAPARCDRRNADPSWRSNRRSGPVADGCWDKRRFRPSRLHRARPSRRSSWASGWMKRCERSCFQGSLRATAWKAEPW